MAAIIGLVIQVLWHVVKAVLVQSGVSPNNNYVAALAFSVMAATDIVIVAALVDVARRLTGERKLGAVIAAVAYIAIAASTLAWEGFNYRLSGTPAVQWWIFMMRDYGWYALDVLAIVGFVLAAGRRAAWLAPIAVGAAILGGRPAFQPLSMQPLSIALVAIKVGLLALFALEAERYATAPEPATDRAIRGLRRLELVTWFCVALTIFEVACMLPLAMSADLPLGIVSMILNVVLAFVAWSIAQARVPNMSRSLWYLSAIANAWAAARLARSWFMTVTRYWGHFDEVPLRAVHWSQAVPGVLASLAALTAIAIYAQRVHTRRLALVSCTAIVLLAVGFALRVVMRDNFLVLSACYFVLVVMTARLYAGTRNVVEGELPRARVVG